MPSRPTIRRMVEEVMRYMSVRSAILHNRSGCTVHRHCDVPFVAVASPVRFGCRSTVDLTAESWRVGCEGKWKAANPKTGGGSPSNTACAAHRKEGTR